MGSVLSALQGVDSWTFLLINGCLQNPLFDLLMPLLSTKRYILLPGAAATLMLLVWGGRRMGILLAVGVAAVLLSDMGTNLIKDGLHRTRPCHVISAVHLLAGCTGSFSLPSNHASNMFAIATVGWLGIPRWRWVLVALAAGVGYSRVYVGVHYPGDVLGGALWGIAVGWVCTWCAGRLIPGWLQPARPTAPSSPACGPCRIPAP
jgi:undecaprenyl-diphosphatase